MSKPFRFYPAFCPSQSRWQVAGRECARPAFHSVRRRHALHGHVPPRGKDRGGRRPGHGEVKGRLLRPPGHRRRQQTGSEGQSRVGQIIFSRLSDPKSSRNTFSRIGTDYAKYLSKKHHVPVIPIHHMEAHALTVRMIEKVANLGEGILMHLMIIQSLRFNSHSWCYSSRGATHCSHSPR